MPNQLGELSGLGGLSGTKSLRRSNQSQSQLRLAPAHFTFLMNKNQSTEADKQKSVEEALQYYEDQPKGVFRSTGLQNMSRRRMCRWIICQDDSEKTRYPHCSLDPTYPLHPFASFDLTHTRTTWRGPTSLEANSPWRKLVRCPSLNASSFPAESSRALRFRASIGECQQSKGNW